MTAYTRNREAAHELALEASAVAAAVRKLIAEKKEWEGTAGELLDVLSALLLEKETKAKSWPKSPLVLSNALRRLAPNLRAVGISVDFDREKDRKRTRKIRLAYLEQKGKAASEPSEASKTQQNEGSGRTPADAPDKSADGRASEPAMGASDPDPNNSADLGNGRTPADAPDAEIPARSNGSGNRASDGLAARDSQGLNRETGEQEEVF